MHSGALSLQAPVLCRFIIRCTSDVIALVCAIDVPLLPSAAGAVSA